MMDEARLAAIEDQLKRFNFVNPLPLSVEPVASGNHYYVLDADGQIVASTIYQEVAKWICAAPESTQATAEEIHRCWQRITWLEARVQSVVARLAEADAEVRRLEEGQS